MMLFYKNRGILVPVFAVVSVLGTMLILTSLGRNLGGIFSKIDLSAGAGIGFLVAAIWTYLVKDEYYKNAEGNRVMMDIENSFFFMSLKIWVFIFLGVGLVFLGNAQFHYFSKLILMLD
jgi:hypothetical protein